MTHPFLAKFFSYDPEGDGFQFQESLEEAAKIARDAIPEYCDDFWDEDGVRQVCAGVILHRAELTYEKTRPSDTELNDEGYDSDGLWWGRTDNNDGISEFDDIWNFTLEPQEIPDEVLALIPTSDLVRELCKRGVTNDDATIGEIQIIYADVSLGRIVRHLEGPAKILVVRA